MWKSQYNFKRWDCIGTVHWRESKAISIVDDLKFAKKQIFVLYFFLLQILNRWQSKLLFHIIRPFCFHFQDSRRLNFYFISNYIRAMCVVLLPIEWCIKKQNPFKICDLIVHLTYPYSAILTAANGHPRHRDRNVWGNCLERGV